MTETVPATADPCASPCSAAASSARRWPGCSPSTPTTWPPASAARSSSSASPSAAPARTARDAGVDPALFTTDAEELVTEADVVVEVIGGIEPARSLILLRDGARRLGRDRPTRRCSPRTAPRCTPRPTSPASTSTSRPPSPAPSRSCARCASRSPATSVRRVLGIVNGTTNYVLDKMDSTGAGLRRGRRAGPGAGLRRGRPDRRRRGLRRRRQGRDPRLAGVPHPGHRSDVYREGITEVTAADVPRRARWAAWSSCWRSASAPADRADGVSRRRGPGAPGDGPAQPPAGRRPRRVQRGLRRGRGRRRADVLRPRRRRRPDRVRRARRRRLRRPAPRRWRRGPGESAYAELPVLADGPGPHALPRQPRRRRPPGRARPGRVGVRRARRVDRDRAPAHHRRARGPTTAASRATSSSSRTRPPTPRSRRPSRPSPSSTSSASVVSRHASRGSLMATPVARRDRASTPTGCLARRHARRHAREGGTPLVPRRHLSQRDRRRGVRSRSRA